MENRYTKYTKEANMIKEYIELGFDPLKNDNPDIQAVFKDDIARNLWLAIKQTHIVSQYFNAACLEVAKIIRLMKDRNEEINSQLLHGLLSRGIYQVLGGNEQEFSKALLPFILGEKNIVYIVEE